jgi:hypothetical protein
MLTVFIGSVAVAEDLVVVLAEVAARAVAALGQVVAMGLAVLPILVGAVEQTGIIAPVLLAEVAAVD